MAYTSQDALIERYGIREIIMLSDRGEMGTDSVDASIVASAIGAAEAMIDGYVGKRYILPLATVPPLIAELALQMAHYKLHIHAAPENVQAAYKQSMQTLRDISDGRVTLPLAEATLAETGDTGVQTTDRERPMTADNLRGLI